MRISTRREFLTTTSLSLLATSAMLGARHAGALPTRISSRNAALSPDQLSSPSLTSEDLRAFAASAVEAGQRAGAIYTDVRVAEGAQFMLDAPPGIAFVSSFQIMPQFMYGIRTLVDGVWSFSHGIIPSTDAITASAREAVATARGYASVGGARAELAPAPVVTGEWATPFQLDAFAVPLGDHAAALSGIKDAAARLRNTGMSDGPSVTWGRETRVFASSTGTVVTQTFRTFEPTLPVSAGLPYPLEGITFRSPIQPMAGGYEHITRSTLHDEIKELAEEAASFLALRRRPLDVGRYPVVVDGNTLGSMFVRTLGSAVELDRVLGDEAGAGGGSYLSPPRDFLGTPVASPLLTAMINRALPSITAAKWDDEGIETAESVLVREGKLERYVSTRPTAFALQQQSGRQGLARSTGCATAPNADDPVSVRFPHVTLAPGKSRATLDELCAGISKGVLIRSVSYFSADHQLSSGLIGRAGGMFEINKGKIVSRLLDNGLQFGTARLWKSLAALGDASTVKYSATRMYKGQPEKMAWTSSTAPAALFKDVDVINIGIRL